MKKDHYYVFCAGRWLKCKYASEQNVKPGWLHYQLSDGTNGLTYNKPGGPLKWAKGILGSHNSVIPVGDFRA